MTNIIVLVIGIAIGFFIARAMKPASSAPQVVAVNEAVSSEDTKVQTQLNNQVDNKKVIAAISAAIMYHNQG
ncbi:MAG: OadG family transporter subunit [Sulfurimonas sp.]|jgi:uncharacterized membrane-anchored protein YhcB (DUF1043 family)|nr:hypothetical protein [Sulfurimonadaceae bacterium]